jgi:demethylmenaquinone methyltransferase/2-methoxy-6-polyprenyl-1,4-benzoquinol methylase
MLATRKRPPVGEMERKRAYVRDIFAAIAPRYDFLNHLLSLNIDRRWRRQAVARLGWERVPGGTYLDLCSGTMDLAAALGNQAGFTGWVIGADFVQRMLVLGRGKSVRASPVAADALALPFPDARFDGATVGFGLRNLADLDAGLQEMARVLKPGAPLVILEFTTPSTRPLRGLYSTYFRHVLPVVGRIFSRHATAYAYLRDSVLAFPEPDALAERVERAGFRGVRWGRLTAGICAWHCGARA